MMKIIPKLSLALLFSLLMTGVWAQSIIRVKHDAPNGGDGQSWGTAYNDLQAALSAAAPGTQIWVSAGVYRPTPVADPANVLPAEQAISFQLINSVEIYGGFAGTEGNIADRVLSSSTITVLSGDIDWQNPNGIDLAEIITDPATQIRGANSYTVVNAFGTDNTAVLDGFTITGGYTSPASSGDDRLGGGIRCIGGSPLLRNLDIVGNRGTYRGGGMYVANQGKPQLTNVKIKHNYIDGTSQSYGAGILILNVGTIPVFNNVEVSDNVSRGTGSIGGGVMTLSGGSFTMIGGEIRNNSSLGNGAGIYNQGSVDATYVSPVLTNVAIVDNQIVEGTSLSRGIGMHNIGSSPILTNVVITGNTSTMPGGGTGMRNLQVDADVQSFPVLNNTIVWGNGTAPEHNIANANSSLIAATSRKNLLQNNAPTGSNIEIDGDLSELTVQQIFADPLNADLALRDFSLHPESPAIDAGDNDLYLGLDANTLDLAGNPRVHGGMSGTIDLGPYESQGLPITPGAGNILYVNTNVSGGNGIGNNWANAIPSLVDALAWADNWNTANGILQIWVAAGVYRPHATDESVSFVLKNGIELYGGFLGTESALGDRDLENVAGRTILSGDIDENDEEGGNRVLVVTNPAAQIQGTNSLRVVMASGTDGTAVLDGFTITAGSATGTTNADRLGGGIYNSGGSPVLRNLDVIGNLCHRHGGGIYNTAEAKPNISNSKIRHNQAVLITGGQAYGAGIFMTGENTRPVLTDVEILDNHSDGLGGGLMSFTNSSYIANRVLIQGNTANTQGGGVYNQSSGVDPLLTNVVIVNNEIVGTTGNRRGGGMYNTGSSPRLTNVVIAGNTSVLTSGGAGIGNWTSSEPVLINTIVWGNGTAANNISNNTSQINATESSNNLIEGDNHANSNIEIDGDLSAITVETLFVDPLNADLALRDFRLAPQSPVIDKGSNEKLWETIQLIEGHTNPMPAATTSPAWGTDLDNLLRIAGNIVDLGAYELPGEQVVTLTVNFDNAPIPATGLELTYGQQGTLTVSHNNSDLPALSIVVDPAVDPLVSLSSTSSSPSTLTALRVGTGGTLTISLPATAGFEEVTQVVDVQVVAKGLTVTANALSKLVGENDPPLAYTVDGLVNNEQATDVLTGALSRQGGEEVGTYPIGQGTLAIAAGNGNYVISSFVGGDFTITAQPLQPQEITFTAPEQVQLGTGTLALSASSSSGLPVTFSVDDASIASVLGTDLHLHTEGTVVVTATQEGNDIYEVAPPVSVTIRIVDALVRVHPAVSPDGNGINDFLRIDRIENYPDNQVTIFDRSGNIVQQITGYDNNQNVFTGETLRHGTYFYRVNLVVDGKREHYQGFIEVKRRN